MKLFIITDVLSDYTSGLVAIKAESLEQAREFFVKAQMPDFIDEFDDAIKNGCYTEFDLADTDTKELGVLVEVYGGG
jgi:5-formaminoimidazole-4-carboxamide-1-beta-D-ribofuranosyl 5'-monophosphate synthetase